MLLKFGHFDFLLEGFNLVPCLESLAQDTKVKLLHKHEILVHLKKHITRNLLIFEDIAVFGINAKASEVVGGFGLIPPTHLFLGQCRILLLVGLVSIDV